MVDDSTQIALNDGGNHRMTSYQQYDDVANTVTRWKVGELHHPDTRDDSSETTAKQIQRLNDRQKVIGKTIQVTSAEQAGIASMTDNQVVDNFGKTIEQLSSSHHGTTANGQLTSDPLITHSTYNADNTLATTTLLTRPNHLTDTPVTVNFQYDLNGKLTSKVVNNVRHYHYYYDAKKALLAEYRCTNADCSQTIHQTYNANVTPNHFNAYQITMTDWSGKHQTVTQYQSVNGKRQIARQQTPDYRLDYTYDYVLGKVLSVTKTPNDGSVGSKITYTYRPDGKLLSQRTYRLQAGNSILQGHPITHTYCTARQGKATLDDLCQKVDAAGVTHVYQYNGGQRINSRLQIGKQWLASSHATFGALGELQQTLRYDYPSVQQPHRVDSTTYGYNDAFKHLTDIHFANFDFHGGAVVHHLHYNYQDRQHNYTHHIMGKVETSDGTDNQITTDYHYGNSGQMLESDTQTRNSQTINTTTQTYQYDQYNPTQITVKKNQVGQMGINQQLNNTTIYHYDSLDRLNYIRQPEQADKRIHYDNNDQGGNMLSDEQGNHYTYNNENKEISYTDKQQQTTTYTYDANALRNSKWQNKTTKLQYLYDGTLLSSTLETQGKEKGDKVAYLDGDDASSPIQARVILNANNQLQQVQFLQHDKRGSTINQLATTRNGKASNASVYHYDDNGTLIASTPQATTLLSIFYNPMQFGRYHDQETGQHGTDYKLARSVHDFGGITRFITMDYGVKLMNLYQLDDGDRDENTDRGGHFSRVISGIFAGVGVAANIGFLFASRGIQHAVGGYCLGSSRVFIPFIGTMAGALPLVTSVLTDNNVSSKAAIGVQVAFLVVSYLCMLAYAANYVYLRCIIRRDAQRVADFAMGTIVRNNAITETNILPSNLINIVSNYAEETYAFDGKNISSVDFSGKDLSGMNFNGSDARNASFTGAILDGATFDDTNLQGADFSGARLHRATFYGATLHDATFLGAQVNEADFSGAILYRTIMGEHVPSTRYNFAQFPASARYIAIFDPYALNIQNLWV